VTGLFGVYPTGLEYRTVIHHVRLYNVSALRNHLKATGFIEVSFRGVSFLPQSSVTGKSVVSRWLGDKLPQLCNNIIALARKPFVSGISL
jgi:hypothetical protein